MPGNGVLLSEPAVRPSGETTGGFDLQLLGLAHMLTETMHETIGGFILQF